MKVTSIILLSLMLVAFSCEMQEAISMKQMEVVKTAISMPSNENLIDQMDQKLMKEATLRFRTEDLAKTRKTIHALIKVHHAYISGEQILTSDFESSEQIFIKVPAANFDSLIFSLSKEISDFEVKEIKVKDVTSEYIDLVARIGNKRALENRFIQLLEKAESVEELLLIENKLAVIREEIEKVEGMMNFFRHKVRYATIEVEYYQNSESAPAFGADISDGFFNGWYIIKNMTIGIVNIWPFLFMAIGGWLLVRERRNILPKIDINNKTEGN